MTEADGPKFQESGEVNPLNAPFQIEREDRFSIEETLPTSISAIALIRPPRAINRENMIPFYTSLLSAGILPIVQSYPNDDEEDINNNFPTDQYREIGGSIFTSHPAVGSDDTLNALYSTLEASKDTKPFSTALKAKEKAAGNPFSGGAFVYDENSKILLYDRTTLGKDEATSGRRDWGLANNTLNQLKDDGWNVIPIDLTRDEATIREVREDLDFIVSSPFRGKDGETYMFAAESVIPNLLSNGALEQTGINFLPVPEEEVLKGGCNIADLNRSKLLVCANREDAPTVFFQLNKLAEAKVIETPRGFLDDGGGPRCSMSSISIPNAA